MKISDTCRALPCLFALVFIASCSSSDAPETGRLQEVEKSVTGAAEVPVGRLGNAVEPVHYRLELRIDPTQDSFSGSVSIDVKINEPVDRIWLHGKGLRGR